MVVLSTKVLNDMRPPGDTAFGFGGSAAGIDLTFGASVVSDNHRYFGQNCRGHHEGYESEKEL